MSTTNSVGKMRTIKIPSFHRRQDAALDCTFLSNRGAGLGLRRTAQQSAFAEDQIEVSAVHKQAARLTKDEHRVLLVNGICKHNHPAGDAAVPEGNRNDAAPLHLAFEPLNDETRGEQRLARKSDSKPNPFGRNPA